MDNNIRVSDYIVELLIKQGVKDVFLLAGGGIMYLLDSIGKSKKIRYIVNHHEQACAIAAEAYARVTNKVGVCFVTTGPGSTNAITGVAGAWVDSIPMLVISGQVKRELIADYKKVRQVGPQEINIIDIIKGITKYAKTIMNPDSIRYEIERAFYEAKNGRPGPVWLNIPLDVQGAIINKEKLEGFEIKEIEKNEKGILSRKIIKTVKLLEKSKRPVILAGSGIRLSGGLMEFIKMVNMLKIPVLTTINGLDLIEESNKYFFGRFGPMGQRRANFVLQNSDLIISIGSSLNVATTGFDFKNFACKAKKIFVNIDKNELSKIKFKIDLSIKCDAKDFIKRMCEITDKLKMNIDKRWLEVCRYWKEKYPVILSEFYNDKEHVNSYVFFNELSKLINSKQILTTGVGLDVVSFIQSYQVRKEQRAFVNKNFGSMGWDLPAVVGTCTANNFESVVCVVGDGSVQLNIQELATIGYYKMPIKIFIFNNGGYKSIRDTQNTLFGGNLVGADGKTGENNPNFEKIASAYGIKYCKIKSNDEITKTIRKVLKENGSVITEVFLNYDQERIPRMSTQRLCDGTLVSKSLEDMYPFLDEKEIWENMHMFDKKKI